LNGNLGFSDEDRFENVRRNAEVAKLFAQQGVITIVSVITPRRALRDLAREVVGADFVEVYVKADYETCARRDPKGLYAKAQAGEVKQFTGKDSSFEEPEKAELVLDTEANSIEDSAAQLLEFLTTRSQQT
jgi:adenylylsulfate kinase